MSISRIALLLALAISCRVSGAAAHDFWVQPTQYWIRPNVQAALTLLVGHGPFRQRSPIAAQRITRFQAISPRGQTIELRDRLRMGRGAADGDFLLPTPGTYVLVLQTDDQAQT